MLFAGLVEFTGAIVGLGATRLALERATRSVDLDAKAFDASIWLALDRVNGCIVARFVSPVAAVRHRLEPLLPQIVLGLGQ
jgi:hypothetical protein